MTLAASGVSVRFGGLAAIDDVSLRLEPGEILGLIGPNGAGKTTFVNVLSGFQRPLSGTISIAGRDAAAMKRHDFAAAGVVRTFQAVRLFNGLSASENVEVGLVARGIGRAEARRQAAALLAELGLAAKADLPARALSYGDERRLGLARALALEPRYLLLDEPAAGLNAAEAEELRHLVTAIRDRRGCGVLVIEHNMTLVMALCDRIHVLASGRTIAAGTPEAVRADPAVREAYLGSRAA